MQHANSEERTARPEWWLWLFPITLVAHIAEEKLGGARFYEWLDRPEGAGLSAGEFFGLTSFAVLGMTALVAAIRRWPGIRWLVVSLAVAVIANGLSHTLTGLAAGTYNPGLATGIVLWWPLGGWALARCWTTMHKRLFWRGALLGVAIQLGVSLTTIVFTVWV